MRAIVEVSNLNNQLQKEHQNNQQMFDFLKKMEEALIPYQVYLAYDASINGFETLFDKIDSLINHYSRSKSSKININKKNDWSGNKN
jgi:hypothetical protein